MNNGTRLTPAMCSDLAEGYKAGLTTTELAKKYDLSKATVCRGLRKVGIEPERKDNLFTNKDLSQEQIDALVLDFRSGYKIVDLCKKYVSSYSFIVKILEEKGLWTRKTINKFKLPTKMEENGMKHILSPEEKQILCNDYVDTPKTKQDLAEEYQVHVDTVAAILRAHNVTVKKYIPTDVQDALCDEYTNGVTSVAELSKIFNLSPDITRYWLTKNGLLDTVHPDGEPRPTLSAAQLRKLARDHTQEALDTLVEIYRDPTARPRERITAAQIVIERGYGKSREEPEEEVEQQSTTAKILSLMPKKESK